MVLAFAILALTDVLFFVNMLEELRTRNLNIILRVLVMVVQDGQTKSVSAS